MDICLSNIPAITFGLIVMDWMGIRRYDWFGRDGTTSITQWKIWTCHKRLGAVFYQQFLLLIHFLTGFFLINALFIPPKHFFPVARLLLWFGFGGIAHREAYLDIETWNTPLRKE